MEANNAVVDGRQRKQSRGVLQMAKKVKRKVSQAARPVGVTEVTPLEVAAPPTPAASPASRSSFSRRTTTAAEFNPDYSYVIKDLKRIGLLAGVFFVILIALSFIIR
jgi:hypothetical protein